VNILNSHLLR